MRLGPLPTPALALAAAQRGAAGLMVTGSHIPDNRNGIKFYRPDGEISKADEEAIRGRTVRIPPASGDNRADSPDEQDTYQDHKEDNHPTLLPFQEPSRGTS